MSVAPELVPAAPPAIESLEAERDELLTYVSGQLPEEIISPQEYAGIAALEADLDAFIDRVSPTFDNHVAAAHKVWKSACDIRSLFLKAPKELKAKARLLLSAYQTKAIAMRRQAERELAEEQHRQDTERQAAEARLLEKQGQPEAAAALRATPVLAPAIVLPSTVPEIEGLTYREEWYWEPVGGDTPANRTRAIAMMVRAEFIPFVKFDDAGLTNHARRMKDTVRIPGIVFRSRQVPVRR
jgi:hypothetical protein